jgi:FkbM family methyltransferase
MGAMSVVRFVWTNPGNRGVRIRKLADAFMWQFQKRMVRRPRTITLANGVRFVAHPDCVISSSLHYTDWPEYAELQFCRRNLTLGQRVIDVGANIGHFSLLLADVVGPESLFCFEPMRTAWDRLVANFRINGWTTSHLENVAVGRSCGTVDFPNPDHPDTTTSISGVGSIGSTVPVSMINLDSIVPQHPPGTIGLLKIDVEGYEREVLFGAAHFLKNSRPKLIMFESLNQQVDPDVAKTLRDADYSVFQVEEDQSVTFDRLDAQNLFAVPNENQWMTQQAKTR